MPVYNHKYQVQQPIHSFKINKAETQRNIIATIKKKKQNYYDRSSVISKITESTFGDTQGSYFCITFALFLLQTILKIH